MWGKFLLFKPLTCIKYYLQGTVLSILPISILTIRLVR